ncbi:MAG: cellulase family glycosylhydrolase [Kiritimatiellae bacterium]|nr:cellulase family glycosylhydrolase [Kiritimatiellia bacterium]
MTEDKGDTMNPIGYLRPKHASEIERSPWGVQMLAVHYLPDEFPVDDIREKTLAAGFKWVRLPVNWARHERAKGEFDWRVLDREIAALTRHGVRVFFEPTLYGDAVPSFHGGSADASQDAVLKSPAIMDGYCRFVLKLAEQYRDQVHHYQLGNEVQFADPADYAALVKRFAVPFRAIHPEHKILLSLTNLRTNGRDFLVNLLADPEAAREIDVFCGHTYEPCPEVGSEMNRAALAAAREKKPGLVYWMGEAGWPSSSNTIHNPHSMPYGLAIQAKGALRRMVNDRLDSAELSIYFINVEHFGKHINHVERGGARGYDPKTATGFNTKGLIQHTTWQPKPAYYALRNLNALIDGTFRVVEGAIETEVVDPGIFYGVGTADPRPYNRPWLARMHNGRHPLLAGWVAWRPQELIQPGVVRVSCPDLAWQDPVRVDLLSGAVYEAAVVNGALEMPLADYPVIVTERAAVDLAAAPQQPSYAEIRAKLRLTYSRVDTRGLVNFYTRLREV